MAEKTDFTGYIAGHDVTGFLASFKTADDAANSLLAYITGEAADETDAYDPDTADEMRETSYDEVHSWIVAEIKQGENAGLLVNIKAWIELEALVWYACDTTDRDGLIDWLTNGLYIGDETIDGLAAGWDAVCAEAEDL